MIFSTVLTILMAGVCAWIGYLALPALTFASAGLWAFILLCLICTAISVSLYIYNLTDDITPIPGLVVISFALVFAIIGITSGKAFHTEKARAVADIAVSDVEISEAFPDLKEAKNIEELPLVDPNTAEMLGDKNLAGLKKAPWYDIDDEYNLVRYQGKLYRLSVIDYGGFLKFMKARDYGTPGYVLVSVTPENGVVTQDAQVVVLDEPIHYTPGASFSKNLRRHLRSQYHSYMFDKSFFEIDEEGTPFWVTGVLRPTASLFGVKTISTFILTNAQTGESKEYKVDEAPEWIDHVLSLDYLMRVADWHYSFVHGYWNSVFSETDVLRTSYSYRDNEKNGSTEFANFFGYSSIVAKDGEIQFYTGLTAANRAESNLGWLTVDTSTGKMIQYEVVGAEESSAQSAVETLVQQFNYEATFPLPVNVGGQPSYLMLLKGNSGLAQGYAICNMENFSIAVQAETLDKAISAYMAKLNGEDIQSPEVYEPSGTSVDTPTSVTKGKIEAIYTAELKGTTQFYYQIGEKLYRASLTLDETQVQFRIGDEISFAFYPEKDGVSEIAQILKP